MEIFIGLVWCFLVIFLWNFDCLDFFWSFCVIVWYRLFFLLVRVEGDLGCFEFCWILVLEWGLEFFGVFLVIGIGCGSGSECDRGRGSGGSCRGLGGNGGK